MNLPSYLQKPRLLQPCRRSLATSTLLALLALAAGSSHALAYANGTWTATGSSNQNYDLTGNWSGGTIADGAGATGTFQVAPSGNQVIQLNASHTLGTMLLNTNNRSQTFNNNATQTLTLDNTGGPGGPTAQITVGTTSGNNSYFYLPILLNTSLNISNNNNAKILYVGITNHVSTVTNNTAGAVTITNNGSGTAGVSFGDAISDGTNGGTLSMVQSSSTSALTLANANTYSGTTTVSAGLLTLGHSLALQSSALDTLNSITGTSTAGLKTTVTTLTLGGLTGNKNIASVFTTTAGGYSAVTALTLNPGSAITHSYSGSLADGATGMTLTKTGSGTQTLEGTNTYTGATSISAGTLALVGGSQTSAISLSGTGSLGFTLGSPTTSTSSVNLGSGTVTITGAVNNASSYKLMTASLGITGALTLASAIPGYTLQLQNGATELWLVYTGGLSPYNAWSGGAAFDADSNGDGVKNGMAWMLGAATKDANATGLLPVASQSSGDLVLDFTCLKVAGRGDAVLSLQYSKDLGISDPWTSHEVVVPDTAGTVGVVVFSIPSTNADPNLVNLRATIPASQAAPGTKLFARLDSVEPTP